jgi:hypothetical protein
MHISWHPSGQALLSLVLPSRIFGHQIEVAAHVITLLLTVKLGEYWSMEVNCFIMEPHA